MTSLPRIGFASADWAKGALDPITGHPTWGGSGWARLGLPAKFLAATGRFECFEGTLVWAKKEGRFQVRTWVEGAPFEDVDLIVLQRWMFASVAVETETARKNGQVVVNDLDDFFWGLDPQNQAFHTTDPKKNPTENRDHYLKVLQRSSAVTVSTTYLADQIKKLGVRAPIFVLENHVDLQAWRPLGVRETSRPTVGWVGATPWRSGDLETLRGILGPFVDRHDLLVHHSGHVEGCPTFSDRAGVNPGRMTTTPMASILDYPRLFTMDVGLVPLRDVAFNRAKSWIKGLEYTAAGVPWIAQDLPEYRRLQDLLGVGRLASRPREWLRHLEDLLDPATRRAEVEENLARIKPLDIREGIDLWATVYQTLLDRG